MGLYKLCKHKGRERDRCRHGWWGAFQHRGRLHRRSLGKWSGREIVSKTDAQAVLDRMKDAIRSEQIDEHRNAAGDSTPSTFAEFVPLYVERYVRANELSSADTIDYRTPLLLEHFGSVALAEIKQADVESFVAKLRKPTLMSKEQRAPRKRRPATINRYLSLLRHMFNWAIEHEFLERSPMARVRQLLEDNSRHRRLSMDEERRLLSEAPVHLRPLIIFASDTGLRKGEMLALRWADLEARPGWIRVRGETAKSGRTRWVPIGTERLRQVLNFLRTDASGQRKPSDAPVFSNEVGEPVRYFQTAWRATLRRAGIEDLHWHDLRHEYASRLVEQGVPLSQVRDLLGHASIVTTERYDNQKPAALLEAVQRLENGESFKNVSTSGPAVDAVEAEGCVPDDRKLLTELEKAEDENGVSDGDRTRNIRSHSPALYH